jgi:hypothetical protein
MPVTSIQALLGHRWLQTTQNYLQISDEQVRNDYETASKKLTGWTVAETAEKRGPKTALSRICPKISNRMITPLIPSGQHRTSYFLKNTKHGYWKPG